MSHRQRQQSVREIAEAEEEPILAFASLDCEEKNFCLASGELLRKCGVSSEEDEAPRNPASVEKR